MSLLRRERNVGKMSERTELTFSKETQELMDKSIRAYGGMAVGDEKVTEQELKQVVMPPDTEQLHLLLHERGNLRLLCEAQKAEIVKLSTSRDELAERLTNGEMNKTLASELDNELDDFDRHLKEQKGLLGQVDDASYIMRGVKREVLNAIAEVLDAKEEELEDTDLTSEVDLDCLDTNIQAVRAILGNVNAVDDNFDVVAKQRDELAEEVDSLNQELEANRLEVEGLRSQNLSLGNRLKKVEATIRCIREAIE